MIFLIEIFLIHQIVAQLSVNLIALTFRWCYRIAIQILPKEFNTFKTWSSQYNQTVQV
jgi:hypothetical protein